MSSVTRKSYGCQRKETRTFGFLFRIVKLVMVQESFIKIARYLQNVRIFAAYSEKSVENAETPHGSRTPIAFTRKAAKQPSTPSINITSTLELLMTI